MWYIITYFYTIISFSYIDKCFTSRDIESELHEVFVMQQLLTIAAHMDLSDEVGRCVKYNVG
jgi:hypothetical protein